LLIGLTGKLDRKG